MSDQNAVLLLKNVNAGAEVCRDDSLTPSDKRSAELAIYHTVQVLLKRSNSPARLSISSVNVDRVPDRVNHC